MLYDEHGEDQTSMIHMHRYASINEYEPVEPNQPNEPRPMCVCTSIDFPIPADLERSSMNQIRRAHGIPTIESNDMPVLTI